MLKQYPRQVKIVYKNFPLRNHKFAVKAAMAAHAADRQGKFWEFHDELFQNYKELDDAKIQEISQKLNLNQDQYKRESKSSEVQMLISNDYNEGNRLGIKGVPALYINGKRQKDWGLKALTAAVEKELKKNTPQNN